VLALGSVDSCVPAPNESKNPPKPDASRAGSAVLGRRAGGKPRSWSRVGSAQMLVTAPWACEDPTAPYLCGLDSFHSANPKISSVNPAHGTIPRTKTDKETVEKTNGHTGTCRTSTQAGEQLGAPFPTNSSRCLPSHQPGRQNVRSTPHLSTSNHSRFAPTCDRSLDTSSCNWEMSSFARSSRCSAASRAAAVRVNSACRFASASSSSILALYASCNSRAAKQPQNQRLKWFQQRYSTRQNHAHPSQQALL
jgi:hypothetical protein